MVDEELLKTLYPDIYVGGSLAGVLQAALTAGGSALTAQQPLGRFSAAVDHWDRRSHISIAAEKRLFLVKFGHRGVEYGHMSDGDLGVVATAIARFLEQRATIYEMVAGFSAFATSDEGRAHEAGRLVEFTWEHLLANSSEYLPAALVSLIGLAATVPMLRQLMPFTSHDYLCFSTTTGFPYSSNCPRVAPWRAGQFRVCAPPRLLSLDQRDRLLEQTGVLNEEVLFEGSAQDALTFVVENLPANCGPAVDGTALDLP